VYSLLDSSGALSDTVTVNIDVFTGTVTGGVTGGVPEPATRAMMLFGFAGIGWTMRRNARVALPA
jgi:hypothetical protein